MAKPTSPKVFLVGETSINPTGLQDYFDHIGVPDWNTDTSNDHEKLIEVAGKSCYMSFDTSLNANLTRTGGRKNAQYIQDGLIGTKHGSVLEHCSVNILITDVSRVVTHELIRHRAGTAFSQLSGRYVSADELLYYLPRAIANDADVRTIFERNMQQQEDTIRELRGKLIDENTPFAKKKEITSALRRLSGNGATCQIMLTANHRALRNILEQRGNVHAEEEIRVLVTLIAYQLKARYPAIYADMNIEVGEDNLATITFTHSKV